MIVARAEIKRGGEKQIRMFRMFMPPPHHHHQHLTKRTDPNDCSIWNVDLNLNTDE